MTDQNLQQLLTAFKEGDEVAFEQVFKQYFRPLRLHAFLLLKNEAEAEDQVQQLFLDIWNKQLHRHIHQSLTSYLHASIRNRCLNCLTKSSVENKKRLAYAEYAAAGHVREQQEQPAQTGLLAILGELPAQRCKAFQLVHLENKQYTEAAAEMGISVNSLKSHLKLAVKDLRVRVKMHAVHPFDEKGCL